MQKGIIRSIHTLIWRIILVLFLALGLSSCTGETRAPETFPIADIVYLSVNGIGFVNSDGSNATSIPFVVKDHRGNRSDWWRPVITGDNQTLVVKVLDYFYHIYSPAHMAVWRVGEFPVLCQNWRLQHMAYLNADQNHVFINTDEGLALSNLDNCGTEEKLKIIYKNINGIPSLDLKYVVYIDDPSPNGLSSDARFVVIRDLSNGTEREIGIGDYPAWSRDNQRLAYTGKDGIYVFNLAGDATPKLVIMYPNPYREGEPTYSEGAYWRIPPEVSWSPDGKWLVYHRWTGTDHDTGGDPWYNAIYKLNIETGEETKIIDHGMYPYWRWPKDPGEK